MTWFKNKNSISLTFFLLIFMPSIQLHIWLHFWQDSSFEHIHCNQYGSKTVHIPNGTPLYVTQLQNFFNYRKIYLHKGYLISEFGEVGSGFVLVCWLGFLFQFFNFEALYVLKNFHFELFHFLLLRNAALTFIWNIIDQMCEVQSYCNCGYCVYILAF